MNKSTIFTAIEQAFPFIYRWYKTFKHRQRRISNGPEHPDKTFYVIGCDDPNGGLFWLINKAIMHIAYAEEKGWTSVIDLQTYTTQYTDNATKGKINVWEMFFKQPCGYSLADISRAKNVIINKQEPSPTPEYLMGQEAFYDNASRIDFFRDVFHRYIRFNDKTEKYLLNTKKNIFGERRNIVGVLCRGTDYVTLRPKGHPIQPSPEEVIADTEKTLKDYGCDYVFLATEDLDILNLFKAHFGDKLLYIDQERFSKDNVKNGELLSATKQRLAPDISPYTSALQYLSAIWLLTECDCFLGGRTGGTKGVLIMSHGHRYRKVYNLGMY